MCSTVCSRPVGKPHFQAREGAHALVVEAQLRGALAGLRGLGRAGIPVAVLGDSASAAGRWSRYATRRLVAPAGDDVAAQGAHLAGLAEEQGALLPFPGSERGIDIVVAAAERSSAIVPPFSLDALEVLRRKPKLAAFAAGAGVRTPPTVVETTVSALRAAPPELPCVVKPVRQEGAVRSATLVDTPGEIGALLGRFEEDDDLLVQPVVPGSLSSLGIVMDREGGVLAAYQQVSVRTWPARAGSSAAAVGVTPDPEVLEGTARLLRAAGYWGLAEVEYLLAPEGATLIDVNPRFYGCLAPAATREVNLPAAWHAAVHGATAGTGSPPAYRAGTAYRWLEADAVAALRGQPGRLLRRSPRPVVGSTWAADDPVPGALMARAAVVGRVRGVLRRARSRA